MTGILTPKVMKIEAVHDKEEFVKDKDAFKNRIKNMNQEHFGIANGQSRLAASVKATRNR